MKKVEPYIIREVKVYDKKIRELREWFGIPEDENIQNINYIGENRIVIQTCKTILDKRKL